MAWDILVKPQFDNGGGGVVTSQPGTLVVYDAEGNVIDTVQVGGAKGHEGYKAQVSSLAAGQGASIEFTPSGGSPQTYNLTTPGARHEFSFGNSEPTLVSDKGAIGSPTGSGASGVPSGFAPGSIGTGAFPAYLGGSFPSPFLADFNPIEAAPYSFTDPQAFAEQFGAFNREEYAKNFGQSQDFALQTLETELQGLYGFVPAAAALKRNELAKDNFFNQVQRTTQLDMALPGVRGQLADQGQRAETYAGGRLPDDFQDRALEIGIRSEAADNAYAGGFGAASSVSRKASDLMSARERFGIAQYGEGLLGQNINQRAQIELAPTSYSDAGQQIRVTPEVGAGRLAMENLDRLNNLTTISASEGLQSVTQQNQFQTSLEQGTRQFNASNSFAASQFNAGVQNEFALTKFGYDVGFAGTIAGAAQTDINTQFALNQQKRAEEIFQDYQQQSQQAGTASSIAGAVGALPGIISSLENIYDLFSGGGGGTQGDPGTGTGGAGTGAGGSFDTGGGSGSSSGDAGSPIDPGGLTPPSDNPYAGFSEQDFANIPDDDDADFDFGDGGDDVAFDTEGDSFDFSKMAYGNDMLSPDKKEAVLAANAALKTAGISIVKGPNSVPAGVNNQGQKLYADPKLASSNNLGTGAQLVTQTQSILQPFGVFNAQDASNFAKLSSTVSSPQTIGQLNQFRGAQNQKGFINATISNLKASGGSAKLNDTGSKAYVKAATTAAQLYANWDRMSGAQKALGLASLGLQTYRLTTGKNLARTPIIESKRDAFGRVTQKGFTVGDALGVFQAGFNAYALAKNWNQLNTFQKVLGASTNAVQLAHIADNLGMLGSGTAGQAAQISATQLTSMGWSPQPGWGIGAAVGASGATIPQGYTQVANTPSGDVVIIPESNAPSASVTQEGGFLQTAGNVLGVVGGAYQTYQGIQQGGVRGGINAVTGAAQAIQSGGALLGSGGTASGAAGASNLVPGSAAGTGGAGASAGAGGTSASGGASVGAGAGLPSALPGALGAASILGGSQIVAANWGRGGAEGGAIGAVGGSAIAGGMYALGATNPYALAAVVTVSAIGGLAKTGKHGDQLKRDSVRQVFESSGLMKREKRAIGAGAFETGSFVTLADGSKFNLAVDGRGGKHQHRYQPTGEQGRDFLASYDIDYTNDLDFATGMGGIALSRMLVGGKATQSDQMGGQIGNAALANIGFGKDMTKENFDKAMSNMRAFYAQSNIGSKADAYALANKAYYEGRLNETDVIQAQQAFNMIFDDNGYESAKTLLTGRERGMEVAPNSEYEQTVATTPQEEQEFEAQRKRFGKIRAAQRSSSRGEQSGSIASFMEAKRLSEATPLDIQGPSGTFSREAAIKKYNTIPRDQRKLSLNAYLTSEEKRFNSMAA